MRSLKGLWKGVALVAVVVAMGCGGETVESPGDASQAGEPGESCPWDHLSGDDCALDCDEEPWPEAYRGMEAAVVEAINERRDDGEECDGDWQEPVAPLELDPVLQQSSRCHSVDLAQEEGNLTHEGSDGRSPEERAVDAGYGSDYVGENLASGGQTAPVVVEQWVDSPGHCLNLMHEDYQDTGVGVVSFEGRIYITQKFGRP